MHLSFLDPLIRSRSLLQHPFYRRWSKGELTLEELRVYAKEYFHLVDRVPGIVARVRDRVKDDPALQRRIEKNVWEEWDHIGLWKRFAASLGVEKEELLAHTPSPATRAAVRSLEELAEEGADAGFAAMYALELELPAIAATKKQGLCDHYGLTTEDAHAYFDEHLKEEEHLDVWRSRDLDAEVARRSAGRSIAAQHAVLDAVCEEAGIPCSCAR